MTDTQGKPHHWALILGASSGFGEATALALAREGYNIFGVHLDRRSAQAHVESIRDEIARCGRQAVFFNVNAAAEDKRAMVVQEIAQKLGPGEKVQVLLHSLAFGTLKPMIDADPKQRLDKMAMDMTLDVMANSLVYWTQDLISRELMVRGGRVFAMTSAGSRVVWRSYGAVSAAKSALESHCRQLASELGALGVSVNAILAGVTDTPALRKIPGNEKMLEQAMARHPRGRLTRPADVAGAIAALCREDAHWITGNTILCDGGETISG